MVHNSKFRPNYFRSELTENGLRFTRLIWSRFVNVDIFCKYCISFVESYRVVHFTENEFVEMMKRVMIAFFTLVSLTLSAQEKYPIPVVDSLIQRAYTIDQSVRLELSDLQRRANNRGYTSAVVVSLVILTERMEQIDRENTALVTAVLKEGWPKGLHPESYHAIWIIVDHADVKTQRKLSSRLEEAADRGDIQKSDWATFKDRILMNSGRPQIFGTQSHFVVKEGKMTIYIWPVKQPALLNELRATVGLSPIEEYVQTLKSHFGTQVIYDPTITVRQLKRQMRENRIVAD